MRKLLVPAIVLLCIFCVSCANPTLTKGEQKFLEAKQLESTDLQKAAAEYKQARALLVKEGNSARAKEARLGWQKIEKITMDYPYTAEAVTKGLKEAFPKISDDKIKSLMSKVDHISSGGKDYYFSGCMNTIFGLDPQLLYSLKEEMSGYKKLMPKMMKLTANTAHKPWQPYTNPVTYLVEGKMAIPRQELPKTGVFKLWIPLPTQTAAQTNVKVLAIAPEERVKYPVRTDGDIGMAYMEFPLEKMKGDLKVNIKYQFTHYEQHFLPVDPNKVGEYDKEGALYKQFTASGQNIRITPEIIKTAQEIAGKETNPYLVAKKIYAYVVDKTTYSLMPHLANDALRFPEAVYVHEHRYGDCGAESTYFSVLCRAVGIPARTTGGFQMWAMKDGVPGAHFWAEFYLPNYGWVPVDTSAAQLYVDLVPFLSKQQQEKFKWFFFGNQDSARCVIQKDVDASLIPPAPEPVLLSMAIQYPVANCETMDELPAMIVYKYWREKMTITR